MSENSLKTIQELAPHQALPDRAPFYLQGKHIRDYLACVETRATSSLTNVSRGCFPKPTVQVRISGFHEPKTTFITTRYKAQLADMLKV